MTQESSSDSYDTIGIGYALTRREDRRLARRIRAALGDARTVVNVGAGTGSYEPHDLEVVAVEPSEVMIAQRPRDAAAVVRAVAEALPFDDQRFDVGMALWTVHHWSDPQRGIAELRPVARRVVIVAGAVTVTNRLWLTQDYWPGMARLRSAETHAEGIAAQLSALGATVRIEPLPLPRDCVDGFGEAYWARPEAYLHSEARAGMSCFRLLEPDELAEGLSRLAADLESGAWDACYRHLRQLDELDCGHRLIIAE